MKTKRWRIVHHIMEGSDPRPVVTHIFYGDTEEQALHVYEAHRKSDKFLRECDDKQLFNNRVNCHSTAYIEYK